MNKHWANGSTSSQVEGYQTHLIGELKQLHLKRSFYDPQIFKSLIKSEGIIHGERTSVTTGNHKITEFDSCTLVCNSEVIQLFTNEVVEALRKTTW